MSIKAARGVWHLHEEDVAVGVGAGVNDEALLPDVATPARFEIDRDALQGQQVVEQHVDLRAVRQPDVRFAQQASHLRGKHTRHIHDKHIQASNEILCGL